MKKIFLLLIISLCIFAEVCFANTVNENRELYAKKTKGDIYIGVVVPPKNSKASTQMKNGVEMAVAEINNSGGINGKKIIPIIKTDDDSVNEGMKIAQSFASDEKISVVIGHNSSYVTVPTASIYQFANILLLAPYATATKLTMNDYGYVFRLLPNDAQMAKYLADYALKNGFKRILIFYTRAEYGRDLATNFERAAKDLDITIVDRRNFFGDVSRYENLLANWKILYRFDAVFLAAGEPDAAYAIKEIRKAGITEPIFGGDGLEGDQLLDIAGKDAEGVVYISTYDPNDNREVVKNFIAKYTEKYGMAPTYATTTGYDAINLIAYAMKQGRAHTAKQIANFLHNNLKNWQGVNEIYNFDKNGDLITNKYSLIKYIVENGKEKILP